MDKGFYSFIHLPDGLIDDVIPCDACVCGVPKCVSWLVFAPGCVLPHFYFFGDLQDVCDCVCVVVTCLSCLCVRVAAPRRVLL